MSGITLESIGREYVTPEELVALLGVSKNVIYRMLHAGTIPNIRAGKRFVIPRRALERLLEDPAAAQRMQREG